jgi:YVTN family beta-propeller protein
MALRCRFLVSPSSIFYPPSSYFPFVSFVSFVVQSDRLSRMARVGWAIGLAVLVISCHREPVQQVGETVGSIQEGGGVLVPTRQLIRPAGRVVEFGGRPVSLVVSADGGRIYVKDNHSIVAIDPAAGAVGGVRQELPYAAREGGSMHGLAISADGAKLYVTTTLNRLREIEVGKDGKMSWGRAIDLKGGTPRANPYPCGVAIGGDGNLAVVCLSMANALAIIDLEAGKETGRVPVGVAPYAVAISKHETLAYVSNWGGRRRKKEERTAKSAGTDTLVDERGVASSGTVSLVDLKERKEIAQIEVGLHPAELKLSADGSRLYVANANSDTVSVIDTVTNKVVETILVRPDPSLPFGSMSNALALSADEKRLFVANGGNNAVAVVRLGESGTSRVEGFIPAGWYPGAVTCSGNSLFVANTKGSGSRRIKSNQKGWAVQQYLGTVNIVDVPDSPTLDAYTTQVRGDARVPQALAAWEKAQADVKATPVPMHAGEPSVFEHVVYVIKENRTYDQVLGDIGRGNSDPKLCVFNRNATPNLHALAEQFVLLDNFYCNGVLSPDGHAWATEGLAVDYLEKTFGGFSRSYPFSGDDPLAFAASGFIWDNVLLHGRSFRNYGEMAKTGLEPGNAKFADVYADWKNGTNKVKLKQTIAIESLRRYSCEGYPGWNLKVPDAVRIGVFMKEFEEAKRKNEWPNFVTVYLPSDHTSGTSENNPTPAAMAADNDLAVGKLVEAISHSSFWSSTCIFIIEDDPQAGFDHVDGHRSVCWVISPYTKRRAIVSAFYNQTSVLHTMELMLGLPPMNQMDAAAPAMRECFTEVADVRPYKAVANRVPLDQMNPKKAALSGAALELATRSEAQDFSEPDRADENTLNRILWHAVKGVEEAYPTAYAGSHGKGLKALGLKPILDDDDDD